MEKGGLKEGDRCFITPSTGSKQSKCNKGKLVTLRQFLDLGETANLENFIFTASNNPAWIVDCDGLVMVTATEELIPVHKGIFAVSDLIKFDPNSNVVLFRRRSANKRKAK